MGLVLWLVLHSNHGFVYQKDTLSTGKQKSPVHLSKLHLIPFLYIVQNWF